MGPMGAIFAIISLRAQAEIIGFIKVIACVNAFDLFDLLIEIDVLWASREPPLGMIRLRCVEKIGLLLLNNHQDAIITFETLAQS